MKKITYSVLVIFVLTAVIITVKFSQTTQNVREYASTQTVPYISTQEIITSNADTNAADGGNGWSSNKSRIVRTSTGNIYASYQATGTGDFAKQWVLMERTGTNTWQKITQGDAGREPVNLLLGQQDQLNIIGWPKGLPKLWTGTKNNTVFSSQTIPGYWKTSNYPYSGAGITLQGNIYLFQSDEQLQPGKFEWGYYIKNKGQWAHNTTSLDYRYCYSMVIPNDSGELSVVGTRDVLWSTLGYKQPSGSFDYVFNAVKYWHSPNIQQQTLSPLLIKEEKPNTSYQNVEAFARDIYVDTSNRMHIIYSLQGPDTNGQYTGHHVILQNGSIVKDILMNNIYFPDKSRIIQDTTGRFWIFSISDNLMYIWKALDTDTDGTKFGSPTILTLTNPSTGQSPHIVAPRGGSMLADYIDGVYNAGSNQQKWVYFRLQLR